MASQRHLQQNDLPGWMRDMERRVRDLERAPTLRNTSMTSGTTTIVDDNDIERLTMGILGSGDYGIQISDEDGNAAFRVSGAGTDLPYVPLATFDAFDNYAYNSGTWTTTRYSTQIESASHAGLYVWMYGITSDASTTGEMRVAIPAAGAYTDPAEFDDGGVQFQFKWLHGLPINSGPYTVQIEARRTAGTGDFFVYWPTSWALVAPGLCTASGV